MPRAPHPRASHPHPRDPDVKDDDAARCGWAAGGDDLLRHYHDEEWGRPVHGERELFQLLTLVVFASGLSWATVLRRRAAFRTAFDGFDAERVAGYREGEVARLVGDAGIIRNRRKIDAAVTNAAATVALRASGGLDALVWSFADAAHEERGADGWRPARDAEVPSSTATSKALTVALRSRGYVLVGPTVAYALMESAGVVDDHVAGCGWAAAGASPRARPPA